ncbi:MAG TPA: hypothetical protein VLE72_01475 [Candidatus Saccharimonadales bacterium]|nr:hypothetical protein [Candidatus Saccharimonadales bacterium]
MREKLNDQVEVLASFKSGPRGTIKVIPHLMNWRAQRYPLDKMGLYHPERRGNKRIHIFSFSSGPTAFRLELDPETLAWTLVEVFYGT